MTAPMILDWPWQDQRARRGPAWKVQLTAWRGKLSMPESCKLWSSGSKAVLTERMKGILDAVAFEKLGAAGLSMNFKERRTALSNVFCDVSQNPMFRTFTNSVGITGCLSTSTCLFSFGRDDFVLPIELLYFQGHGRSLSIPPHMRQQQIRDLAGEGISLPCLGVIMWAIYLTKGFP